MQSAAKELIQKHGFEYELTSRFNQDAIENFLLLLNRELKDLQLTQKHSVGKKNRKLEKSSHQSPVTMQLYVCSGASTPYKRWSKSTMKK